MPTNHDEDMLEEYDFSQAKRGLVIPQPGKTRMSIWVDTDVYEAYMAYSARLCRDVAPEMNDALRQYIEALGAQTVASAETPHDHTEPSDVHECIVFPHKADTGDCGHGQC